MLNTNNIKTNGKAVIDRELEKNYLGAIEEKIKREIVYPQIPDIFRAFNFFDIEDTKIVIFGQDPYHGEGEANGLAFSVNEGIKLPPSLKNIFKKIQQDFHITKTSGDLTAWAQQGFLLLNTCLTVSKDCARSHYQLGGEKFVIKIIDVINKKANKVLFVLWGNDAKQLQRHIDTTKHAITSCNHPSPLSANRGGWFDASGAKDIAAFLKKYYQQEIIW